MRSGTSIKDSETYPEPLPWHKPEVARIKVSLDTGLGGGSGADFEGGEFTFSDVRLKHSILPLENPLQRLESASVASQRLQYGQTIAVLV